MDVHAPELYPDPDMERAAMEAQQRAVASTAVFVDDGAVDPTTVAIGDAETDGVVVGVDQAFRGEEALSAAVAIRDGTVIEEVVGRAPVSVPYIPGLLSYREAGAIIDALQHLSATPDVVLFDGSGRIHYRQAGIATHVGVLFDVPSVGVTKNLLCGTLRESVTDPLSTGTQIPIEADDQVEPIATDDPDWPVIGAAYQSRQFADSSSRHVNPIYVSPGHRVDLATALDVVAATGAGYKLPEPIRRADAAADRA
ncbi:MAG: endonuclease V [Halobacteriaceae archaeon]